MAGLPKDFLLFLKDLSKNNNREWFHANKKRYEQSVKNPFRDLIQIVIDQLNKKKMDIPIVPKDTVFRINRDIRFSKDKSPYKTNVGGIVSKYGRKRKDYPGFYIHVSSGELMIGGGAYFMEKETIYAIRRQIADDPKAFSKIVKNKKFAKFFGGIKGEQNKRIPKEFQAAHEIEPLIANKQFYFMAELDPQLAIKDDLSDRIIEHCLVGQAFNDFLLEATGME